MGTALVTGVGRRRGIGAGLALAQGPDDPPEVAEACRALGHTVDLVPGDLAEPDTPARLVSAANRRGDLTGGWVTGQVLHSNGGLRTAT